MIPCALVPAFSFCKSVYKCDYEWIQEYLLACPFLTGNRGDNFPFYYVVVFSLLLRFYGNPTLIICTEKQLHGLVFCFVLHDIHVKLSNIVRLVHNFYSCRSSFTSVISLLCKYEFLLCSVYFWHIFDVLIFAHTGQDNIVKKYYRRIM